MPPIWRQGLSEDNRHQATYEGFAGRGLGADAATGLMQRSVQLAREARDAYWSGLAEADRASRLRPLVACWSTTGPCWRTGRSTEGTTVWT